MSWFFSSKTFSLQEIFMYFQFLSTLLPKIHMNFCIDLKKGFSRSMLSGITHNYVTLNCPMTVLQQDEFADLMQFVKISCW